MIVVVLVAKYTYTHWSSGCTTAVIDGLPSPTGSWTAVVEEETCDDVEADAELMPTGRPAQVVTVLTIETDGHSEERPRVAWSALNILQVTAPAKSYLKVFTRQVGNVHINLAYEPDYATRQAWLKTVGEKPGPLEQP